MRAPSEGAATLERGGRRGRESINVDLSKVDAVVAKVTEMAAHRSSYQGMVGQLMETTGEARGNILRLRQLALSIGNECATARPEPAAPARRQEAGDLDLESYNALATLALQLQEAVADQQALIEKMYDTITNHWSLRATESRVDVAHCHPFWARPYPDIAVVHNGQITNYRKLRRLMEMRGVHFSTGNDSEIIGLYLAEHLAAHGPLPLLDGRLRARPRPGTVLNAAATSAT